MASCLYISILGRLLAQGWAVHTRQLIWPATDTWAHKTLTVIWAHMQLRSLIFLGICAAFAVSVLNLFSDSFSNLPNADRIEAARQEAREKPFLEREHKLERRPRLESHGMHVQTSMHNQRSDKG